MPKSRTSVPAVCSTLSLLAAALALAGCAQNPRPFSADVKPGPELRTRSRNIVVAQAVHAAVNTALATRFADPLLSKPVQQQIAAFGRDDHGQSLFLPDSNERKATASVRFVSGDRSRTFTLDDLREAAQATLADVEYIGVKKGGLGKHTWTGASLKDLLLLVDPDLAAPSRSASTIEIVSSDGWVATLTWDELFGQVSRGEGLYRAKGCNECHGLRAEGTSPEGKRPAPKLLGRTYSVPAITAVIRTGTGPHAGITAYTAERLSDADLATMLGWLARPVSRGPADTFVVPETRRAVVLAHERDGKAMTGREGLIQLVVGADEFASRYSHWVSEVRVH